MILAALALTLVLDGGDLEARPAVRTYQVPGFVAQPDRPSFAAGLAWAAVPAALDYGLSVSCVEHGRCAEMWAAYGSHGKWVNGALTAVAIVSQALLDRFLREAHHAWVAWLIRLGVGGGHTYGAVRAWRADHR